MYGDDSLALGYGTKIISSPTSYLNGENREYYHELLEIPEDMSAVGLLLIGKYSDTNDAVTGANQHVENFPDVTVNRKEGRIKGHPDTLDFR